MFFVSSSESFGDQYQICKSAFRASVHGSFLHCIRELICSASSKRLKAKIRMTLPGSLAHHSISGKTCRRWSLEKNGPGSVLSPKLEPVGVRSFWHPTKKDLKCQRNVIPLIKSSHSRRADQELGRGKKALAPFVAECADSVRPTASLHHRDSTTENSST